MNITGDVALITPTIYRGNSDRPLLRVTAPIIFDYSYKGLRKRATVGVGFQTDLISAADWQREAIAEFAGHKTDLPTTLHDMICQSHDIEKAEADHVLNEAMKDTGVFPPMRFIIFEYVSHRKQRESWPQPDVTPIAGAGGLVGGFVECPVVVLGPA